LGQGSFPISFDDFDNGTAATPSFRAEMRGRAAMTYYTIALGILRKQILLFGSIYRKLIVPMYVLFSRPIIHTVVSDTYQGSVLRADTAECIHFL
jgi:hypothetical protein